jgi:hypothetical protein
VQRQREMSHWQGRRIVSRQPLAPPCSTAALLTIHLCNPGSVAFFGIVVARQLPGLQACNQCSGPVQEPAAALLGNTHTWPPSRKAMKQTLWRASEQGSRRGWASPWGRASRPPRYAPRAAAPDAGPRGASERSHQPGGTLTVWGCARLKGHVTCIWADNACYYEKSHLCRISGYAVNSRCKA